MSPEVGLHCGDGGAYAHAQPGARARAREVSSCVCSWLAHCLACAVRPTGARPGSPRRSCVARAPPSPHAPAAAPCVSGCWARSPRAQWTVASPTKQAPGGSAARLVRARLREWRVSTAASLRARPSHRRQFRLSTACASSSAPLRPAPPPCGGAAPAPAAPAFGFCRPSIAGPPNHIGGGVVVVERGAPSDGAFETSARAPPGRIRRARRARGTARGQKPSRTSSRPISKPMPLRASATGGAPTRLPPAHQIARVAHPKKEKKKVLSLRGGGE